MLVCGSTSNAAATCHRTVAVGVRMQMAGFAGDEKEARLGWGVPSSVR